jgi:hypothetical protein
MGAMIKPEQIPDEAAEAGWQEWARTAGVNEVIAAGEKR